MQIPLLSPRGHMACEMITRQVAQEKSGMRESRCPVKGRRPQESLLTTEPVSRWHSKVLKEWGGERKKEQKNKGLWPSP